MPSPATVDPQTYPSKEAYDIEAVFGDKCLASKDTKESGYDLGGEWNALADTRQSWNYGDNGKKVAVLGPGTSHCRSPVTLATCHTMWISSAQKGSGRV